MEVGMSNGKWNSEMFSKDMDGEIWKDFDGYRQRYSISNMGRIRSKKSNGFTILKFKICRQGYYRVQFSFRKMGNRIFYVHQLLGILFIPNPENKPYINHINGIKTDNSLNNLEWVTAKENINHAVKTGLWENKSSRLKKDVVLNIRDLSSAHTHREISRITSLPPSVVSNIINKKTYKNI